MFDAKEVAIWAIAFGSAVGVIAIKPFKSTSCADASVAIAEVGLETETSAYYTDITAEEDSLVYECETTEPETLADIETYLEAWSFAERVKDTEETIGAGCFDEELQNADSMSMDLSESDITALQRIAVAEAGVDGITGEAFVMRVVLNRVYSDEFPNSVLEVISQENQFTTYSNGAYDVATPDDTSREAWALIENGWDESQGAMWFERTTDGSTWHNRNLTYLFSYGGHSFYTE